MIDGGWFLMALFLYRADAVHERFATRELCVATLREMQIIAKRDFYSGVCRNGDDEEDTVTIEQPLPVEAFWP